MGDFFKFFWPSHNIWTLWSSKGFFSCMKISTHCTYFMTSLPIVNHIGIVNVEPMWDIDISDTPKRFVHSSRTQIFEFPVNRSDFRHHAMRDTWRLNYNHRERHRMGNRMCNRIFISGQIFDYIDLKNKPIIWIRHTFSHLFCTLISENQGLDKSSSVSNLRKISVPVHLNFFQVYGTNLKKIQLTNWKKFRSTEKKSGVQDLKFF